MKDFAAIDFETANSEPTSVCSVGIVIVRDGQMVDSFYSLIKPEPEYYNYFCSRVHGLSYEDTAQAPIFPDVWKQIEKKIEGLPLVAHNKAFDEKCLKAVFRCYQMDYPDYKFYCTLQRSRKIWHGGRHTLDVIAARCGDNLENHHHALADAEACAAIAIQIFNTDEKINKIKIMKHFDTDYMEGAHPQVMQRLVETNLLQTPGYGTDSFCKEAKALIRRELGTEDVDIHFLVGGTQTNSTVIDGILSHHEGVLAAETAHINVHESGAIESCGHKVLTLPAHDGKIDVHELDAYIKNYYADETYEHMVAPGMVYISYPTEYGTLYSKEELTAIHTVCQEANMPLYIDGARLGYGLASDACDIQITDLPNLCDAFYIGGTKVGAMFGECVVAKKGLLKHFFPLIKQHGALMAKGRLLGVQFGALFTDHLYLKISRHAIELAMMLKKGFIEKGYQIFLDSPTNQQFFVLPNEVMDRLAKTNTFEMWGARGEKQTTVRFVTSWATKQEDVEALIHEL